LSDLPDQLLPLDPDQSLPLDALHRRLGGRMVSFAGYAMPIQFEGIIAEHLWTRQHAGLFDVSHMGQVLLPLAQDGALEALLPGDITGLAVGALRYSLLLDDNGGILDDLMVTRRAGDLYLVVNGAVKAADIAHLRAHGLDVTYRDDWALLALQGPEAVKVLERLVPGVEALRFMRAAAFTWAGQPLWISRSGYTGEDGFEISVAASAVEAFADALLAEPEVRPIGLGFMAMTSTRRRRLLKPGWVLPFRSAASLSAVFLVPIGSWRSCSMGRRGCGSGWRWKASCRHAKARWCLPARQKSASSPRVALRLRSGRRLRWPM
jgi:glycine cleavage system aminomethyltransferase T